jgi:arylsulfatase A-like enzyme
MLTYRSAAGTSDKKDDVLFVVTDGTWKYIHHALRPEESELYNLKDDPRELTNLRDSQPEQVARLLADLQDRKCAPTGSLGREPMSEEDRRRLRSLGYVP